MLLGYEIMCVGRITAIVTYIIRNRIVIYSFRASVYGLGLWLGLELGFSVRIRALL